MLELLWEKSYRERRFDRDRMEELAAEVGLEHDRFVADMAGSCRDTIARDQRDLAAVGVRGTPAFFVNGRFLSGAQPIEQFRLLIDEELALANRRIRAGTRIDRYYDAWVLDKGKSSL